MRTSSSALRCQSRKVLIVDDELILRQATARFFNRAGFECDLASDGSHALELLSGRQYDLVITDLRMPSMHGHSLCVELLERRDRPVIIVVTGVVEPKLERDLRARGVDEIAFKPVDFDWLLHRADKLLVERAKAEAPSKPAAESPSAGPLEKRPRVQQSPDVADGSGGPRQQPASSSESIITQMPPAVALQPTATVARASDIDQRLAENVAVLSRVEHALSFYASHREHAMLWAALIFGVGILMGWGLAMMSWQR